MKALKTVEPMDFVARAISKDEGRYNLTGAYRDKDRLVSTDGHRLHMIEGLANQEKGGFVDGRACEFPNYETVLPKNKQTVATITLKKDQLRKLKKLADCHSDSRNVEFKLEFKREGLIVSSVLDEALDMRVSLKLSADVDREVTVGVNLRYFIDAFLEGHETVIEMTDIKPTPYNGPVVMSTKTCSTHGGVLSYSAIVMSLRLDK